MKTTVNKKWFFPAQEKIAAYLEEKFGECYRCEFQDVCEYVAYENYTCWHPKVIGQQQEHFTVQFVIHKHITENQKAPAIIQVLYGKYEDTMQYFQPSKAEELSSV